MNKLLYKIVENLKPADWYLDLGCGNGLNCLEMKKKGFNAIGVDHHCGARADFYEDIRNFDIIADKYSVISIFYVLHFLKKEQAIKLLNNIQSKIRSGGYIVLDNFSEKEKYYHKDKGFFTEQELKNIFSVWDIVWCQEVLVHDNPHKGNLTPHDHHTIQFIAKKILS